MDGLGVAGEPGLIDELRTQAGFEDEMATRRFIGMSQVGCGGGQVQGAGGGEGFHAT